MVEVVIFTVTAERFPKGPPHPLHLFTRVHIHHSLVWEGWSLGDTLGLRESIKAAHSGPLFLGHARVTEYCKLVLCMYINHAVKNKALFSHHCYDVYLHLLLFMQQAMMCEHFQK